MLEELAVRERKYEIHKNSEGFCFQIFLKFKFLQLGLKNNIIHLIMYVVYAVSIELKLIYTDHMHIQSPMLGL